MAETTVRQLKELLEQARATTERAALAHERALAYLHQCQAEEETVKHQLDMHLIRRGPGEQSEPGIHRVRIPAGEDDPTYMEPPNDPTGVDCWERWSGIDE